MLQAASHLRLDHDSVIYLKMAIALADGRSVTNAQLPPGYPALIAILDRAGVASGHVFVLLNCAFIALGLFAVLRMPGAWSKNSREVSVVLTMLSFPLVRSVAMPLSDAVFFGLSIAAVAAMSAAIDEARANQGMYLLIATALTAAALPVRLAGIALLPVLAFTIVRFALPLGFRRLRWLPIATAFTGLLALSFATVGILGSPFFRYASAFGKLRSPMDAAGLVIDLTSRTISRIGELAINLPSLQFEFVDEILFFVGLVALHPLVAGLRKLKRITPFGVYAASYIGLMFAWPQSNIRLWLPVAPFLILFSVSAAEDFFSSEKPVASLARFAKGATGVYVLWYALAGLGALAWTTRISLSGDKFSSRYGANGGMVTPGFEAGNPTHNTDARMLIMRFDR